MRELSAPLAAAGISILYQSSYMSDFIFVKSSRLAQVMQLLARAGFDLYSSDPSNFTAQVSTFTSPLLSPADDDGVPVHLLDLGALASPLHQRVDPEGGAVFTRSRSSTTGTSSSSGSRGASIPPLLHMSNPGDFTSPFDPSSDEAEEADDDLRTPAIPPRPAMTRSQSHSPSGCDVSVLAPDLTYVGLRDDSAETWGLKIVKLVAFPELIVGRDGKPIDSAGRSRSNSLAMLSRCSPPPSVLNGVHPPLGSAGVPGLHVVISGSDGEGGNASGSDTTTRVGPDSPKEDPALFAEPESPLYDSSEERPWEEAEGDTSDDDSDSEPFDDEHGRQRSHSETRPRLTHHDTVDTLQTVDTVLTTDTVRPPAAGPRERSASVSSSASSCASIISPPPVPFFSFTRTAEGSSLTAPVELLAALFPPSERHMVICSDELDVLDSRAVSPTADPGAEEDEEDDDEGAREAQGPMRCLQIDLRKFGLDKHGLVNRFSRTLEENGINHMYNSTYKTANLLVDKAHATRAQARTSDERHSKQRLTICTLTRHRLGTHACHDLHAD